MLIVVLTVARIASVGAMVVAIAKVLAGIRVAILAGLKAFALTINTTIRA
jgi:hypothetical protein